MQTSLSIFGWHMDSLHSSRWSWAYLNLTLCLWLSEFSFSFHIGRDAAALAEFWCWLEKEIENNVTLTEVDVADKLLEFRQKQDFFIETSFDTISGMFPCSCWQFCPTIYKLLHLRYILSSWTLWSLLGEIIMRYGGNC